MALQKEVKQRLIGQHRIHEKDTGSTDVQIAILTNQINSLSDHFQTHKKDHHSKQGLLKMISRRRKLLDYLKRCDPGRYKKIIQTLEIRK
jgi:small subunit ribosomal protein S15